MIAEAYLVLTVCSAGVCHRGYGWEKQSITAVTIPQPSMDQCIRQAVAFNKHRPDMRAMCVPGQEKP